MSFNAHDLYHDLAPRPALSEPQRCALAFAISAARHEAYTGEPRASWEFHQCMPADMRRHFDHALVAIEHPSAMEAGTTEQRFNGLVRELVAAAR